MRIFGIVLLVVVLMVAGVASFLLLTQKGVEIVLDVALAQQSLQGDVTYKSLDGNLIDGVTLRHLTVTNLEHLPSGSQIKIQQLYIDVNGLTPHGLVVDIENARLRLPKVEPIILRGRISQGVMDLNMYANRISLNALLMSFPNIPKSIARYDVSIGQIDLHINGKFKSPTITGMFLIDHAQYNNIVLSETNGTVDVVLKKRRQQVKLDGEVIVETGIVQSKRTRVRLDRSALFFHGKPDQPNMNIKGRATIDNVNIDIGLKGTLDKPDLQLTSQPSLPRERLMLMLATGKKWQDIDTTQGTAAASETLTKDFIDYFLFAGQGNRFAQKFGLKTISVNVDKNTQGVTAEKGVTKKLDVRYGVEQSTNQQDQKDVTQKVGGNYQLTDTLSVDVEQQIKQQANGANSTNDANAETSGQIMLKYKTSF